MGAGGGRANRSRLRARARARLGVGWHRGYFIQYTDTTLGNIDDYDFGSNTTSNTSQYIQYKIKVGTLECWNAGGAGRGGPESKVHLASSTDFARSAMAVRKALRRTGSRKSRGRTSNAES